MIEENALKDGFYHFAPIYTPSQENPLNTATHTLAHTQITHHNYSPSFSNPMFLVSRYYFGYCRLYDTQTIGITSFHFVVGFRKQLALENNSVFVLHVTAYM